MPPAKKQTTDKKPPAKKKGPARKKKQSADALAIASTSEERDAIIQDLVAKSDKMFGKGALGTLRGKYANYIKTRGVISTGSLALNQALGIGGFPMGRIVEIYGPESCLAADTFIQYNVRDPETGRRHNHKGGAIAHLFNRFHGIESKGKGAYQRDSTKGAFFTAPCMNEEGRIFHNRIIDVVKTGEKGCYRIVTAEGQSIEATEDHKFFNGERFVRTKDLCEGDTTFIHNGTPFRVAEKEGSKNPSRHYLYVKAHGVAGVKVVRDLGRGYEYTYFRLLRSRAVVEAGMNGMTLDAYVEQLNSGDITNLKFLPRHLHVHHKDEDVTNDDRDNLIIIEESLHGRHHAIDRHNNLRFAAVPATIESVTYVGVKETYDIRMDSPFNNYVANGFVVHNSGKTTMMLHAIAECQKAGGIAAFIDAEHAFDATYAEKVGVDLEHLLLSQPDSGEQALQLAETMVRQGGVDIIVIDSVAALVPLAELQGEVGDHHVGLQARMMSQACRKLCGAANNSNTVIAFINQIRYKIGIKFGSPETTSGGNALKFYSSIRLDIRRIGSLKKGDENYGNRVKIKVVKNKLAPPFKVVEADLIFGRGIAWEYELLDMGLDQGHIRKSGSWYSLGDERLGQGRLHASQRLVDDVELATKLRDLVLA